MALTGNIEPIEDYGRDFEAGVLQTSSVPVIFIDPKGLNGTPLDNPGLLRDQLDAQLPGLADEMGPFVDVLAEKSLVAGPFALPFEFQGEKYCLINKPPHFLDEKHEMVEAFSNGLASPNAPGTDSLWNLAVGVHEGQHCNQAFNEAAMAYPEKLPSIILSAEADADRATIDYLQSIGADDMAQALKDYRAIRASADPEHATSALVDRFGEIQATPEHLDAAMHLEVEMTFDVAERMGLEVDQAQRLLETNPRSFIQEVEKALGEGVYDSRPELKRYVEDFTEGYRRQILDNQPIRNDFAYPPHQQFSSLPEGGTPSILRGDIRDQMQIGGVSASSFFASHADPALAQQRLDMQNTPTPQAGYDTALNNTPAFRPGGMG